jgi:hypothetical protein
LRVRTGVRVRDSIRVIVSVWPKAGVTVRDRIRNGDIDSVRPRTMARFSVMVKLGLELWLVHGNVSVRTEARFTV